LKKQAKQIESLDKQLSETALSMGLTAKEVAALKEQLSE
jgi:hypothetical protein